MCFCICNCKYKNKKQTFKNILLLSSKFVFYFYICSFFLNNGMQNIGMFGCRMLSK